ncbi:MAG: TolC family protein [Bacteroidetes bacterium]|jgi:outer membrane protein TolC|nr:TolC family protein [Bacteroidota bacterium]
MRVKGLILFFIAFHSVTAAVSFQAVHAQELLTLDEAVSIGLENNFGIRLAENQVEIAENDRSVGNAGFLPMIDLTANRTERVEDSEFQAGGEARSTSGARSNNTNASLNFDWTIFDGLQMFNSYNRLGKLEELRRNELNLEQELLVRDITLAYYNLIRITEQLKILENNISVSQERIEIEETKVDLGSGSEYDLLQARADLSADQAAFLRESNSLTEARITLNELLSRSPAETFAVESEIAVRRELPREELYTSLISSNTELALARIENDVRALELREVQGERYPELTLRSGYSYNRNENDGGFIRFNETTGFFVGITARVPIFDGFNQNRRIQNAKISQRSAELSLEQQKLRIETLFESAYRTYQNAIELVDLETDNLENAERTLNIALERFRLGSISSLEFREAQTTFLQAENRLINAKYEAKVSETELLRLSGRLARLYAY